MARDRWAEKSAARKGLMALKGKLGQSSVNELLNINSSSVNPLPLPDIMEVDSLRGKYVPVKQPIKMVICHPRGGTPILGHIRDVRPEWVSFPGRKPADGSKFFTKNLRMGHNFDIFLPGNGWFSSKLNKTYCSLVNL